MVESVSTLKKNARKNALFSMPGVVLARARRTASDIRQRKHGVRHQVPSHDDQRKLPPGNRQHRVIEAEGRPEVQSAPLDIKTAVAIEQALMALPRHYGAKAEVSQVLLAHRLCARGHGSSMQMQLHRCRSITALAAFAGFRNCALISSWHGDVAQYLRSHPGRRFFHAHGPRQSAAAVATRGRRNAGGQHLPGRDHRPASAHDRSGHRGCRQERRCHRAGDVRARSVSGGESHSRAGAVQFSARGRARGAESRARCRFHRAHRSPSGVAHHAAKTARRFSDRRSRGVGRRA